MDDAEREAFLEHLRVTQPRVWEALRPRPEGPPTWSLCIHEAAHAALIFALGRGIEYAFVCEHSGAVQPDRSDEATAVAQKDPVGLVAMVLAGDMAAGDVEPLSRAQWLHLIETYISGGKLGITSDCDAEAQSDEQAAITFAHAAAGTNDVDEIYRQIVSGWNRAVDILGKPDVWSAILALASALRVERRIDGARVHEILGAHLKLGAYKQ